MYYIIYSELLRGLKGFQGVSMFGFYGSIEVQVQYGDEYQELLRGGAVRSDRNLKVRPDCPSCKPDSEHVQSRILCDSESLGVRQIVRRVGGLVCTVRSVGWLLAELENVKKVAGYGRDKEHTIVQYSTV